MNRQTIVKLTGGQHWWQLELILLFLSKTSPTAYRYEAYWLIVHYQNTLSFCYCNQHIHHQTSKGGKITLRKSHVLFLSTCIASNPMLSVTASISMTLKANTFVIISKWQQKIKLLYSQTIISSDSKFLCCFAQTRSVFKLFDLLEGWWSLQCISSS